jgi:tRNA/tmRNA/rRNA uracil-C5-methylase (TrmA/RlmC/RlmD family)
VWNAGAVTDQLIELEIERVAHGGVFVARHEGRVVFVSAALPGERVIARVTEDSAKSYWRAEVVEVLTASPHRRPHVWPVAQFAGVEFGHIAREHQLELKGQVLREALSRMAEIESAAEVQALPGDRTDGLAYRTRVQLHVGIGGVLGVHRERSHDLLEVSELPLAVETIAQAELHLKKFPKATKVSIAADDFGGLQWRVDDRVFGDTRLRQRAGGREFALRGGFWQVHRLAAEQLVSTVLKFAGELQVSGRLLDLYSGAGLFAANLAAADSELLVTAVESSKQSISDGAASAKDLSNLSFEQADVLRFLRDSDRKFDAVVMDPPRSGATGKVIAALDKTGVNRMIYVACDPVALARDLGLLLAAGWRLHAMEAFDLFPHTHHFEIVVALTR